MTLLWKHWLLVGTNLTTTSQDINRVASALQQTYPEVIKVVSRIGSSEIPTDPMPIDAGDMIVVLKDKSQWTSAETFTELADKMAATAQEVLPGVTTSFQYPVQMRFNELMTGAKQDVVCKIFGENLDTLAAYAERLGGLAQTVKGTADWYVETVTGMPQIIIDFNRPQIASYGLNIEDVNRTINAAFAGAAAGQIYEGEKRFDLVVRVGQEDRKNIDDVRNLLISTPTGMQIPLYQVATIEEVEGPNQIQRENARRRIIVGFNVRGRDVQSIVEELQHKVNANIKFQPGYTLTYGGAFENLQQAKARLSIAVPVALLLIFGMLYFAFSSVREGALIFTAIPLSAIGGVFALAYARHAFQHFGRGWIYCIVRRSGTEWHCADLGVQSHQERGRRYRCVAAGYDGHTQPPATCAYDCRRCIAGLSAYGVKQWRRRGSTAAAGHGCYRWPDHRHAAYLVRTTGAVRVV